MQFLPISPLQVVRFEKFQDKSGLFFKMNILSTTSYVILKNAVFVSYLLTK